MLKRFEVRNYKNFKDSIVVDFSKTGGYKYNSDCVSNDLISKMLIYGRNASGKTNLGRALMDIYYEISDNIYYYDDYSINADTVEKTILFSYEYMLDTDEVVYSYSRNVYGEIVIERLFVNNNKIYECNYEDWEFNFDNLKLIAAQSLNTDIYIESKYVDKNDKKDSGISFLKWLFGNAAFPKDSVMVKLRLYIDNMAFLSIGEHDLFNKYYYRKINGIFDNESELKKFEYFINEMGIDCDLYLKKLPDGRNEIYFKHNRPVSFFENASSGTIALYKLYSMFIRKIDGKSLVYLDEFDAFYHYEMADNLVKFLKTNYPDSQIIMTTHNTNLMTNRLMRPDCLFILSSSGKLTALCDATERELREGHNLEKMYISGEFEKYE